MPAQVLGPVFATTLSLSRHPQAPFILCAVLIFTGGISLAFSRASRGWIPETRESGIGGVWRNRAMQVLMLEGCFLGLGWGAFNVAVPAFATLEHVAHRTAWILAIMSICNIVGGLIAGLVSNRASAWRAMRTTYFFWFLATLPLAITYPGWSLALVCAFTGLFGGAIQIFYWEVMEAVRPTGTATSALGWLWSVEGSFVAIGSALGGVISKNLSPRYCLAMTSAAVGIGFVILSLGREKLKAADRIPTQSEIAEAISDLPSHNS
jgi:MFS family permease